MHHTYTHSLLHHKIALTHIFPMVLLSLNLAQPLWSYNQIITWYLHCTYRLYLLHHKIALNHSFPMVLLSLNLAQPLWSYNQIIITWYLHGTHMVPMGKWVFLHQF